ncbi:MAG: hypothetical protein LQ350_003430 [Teloschistes chrysophthalmus]|nr:MAG: hypothetical protein LQ350_003430 [Niorma chrysophthalma]
MAPANADPGNEDYDSAADSDFGGSLSPSSGDDSSGSDDQGKKSTKSSGRRKRSIEDSGDEGVVKEGKKKRRKKDKAASKEEDEGTEESAIGMRVRDRKLGRAAEQEKKPLASSGGATVDVDALWARMNGPGPSASSPQSTSTSKNEGPRSSNHSLHPQDSSSKPADGATQRGEQQAPPQKHLGEDTIVIKRTYEFAGETITEQKIVPKSSAEARVYLESQNTQVTPTAVAGGKPIRRPLRKKSMFEPNPEGNVKGLVVTPSKGPKLNTIEKSKLDWASHVDKEGLKEELDVAEKAKGGYLGRMDFLGRSEAKREEDLKNAKKR